MANQTVTPVVDKAPPRPVRRTILAIAAGFLAVVLLSVGTDLVLHLLKIFPPLNQRMAENLFVWATFYRTIYGILGSYITARLAPYRPMRHAMVGALIGMLIGTVGAVATWNKDLGPHWYPVALVLTGIPCAWIGARIREAQISKSQN
jgi:surface polysaccharide O-acyltransferase-like enzyme